MRMIYINCNEMWFFFFAAMIAITMGFKIAEMILQKILFIKKSNN